MASPEVKELLKSTDFGSALHEQTAVIIDPDTRGRLSLAAGLSKKGFDVWGADDCATGITTIAARSPGIVVAELRLPDASGLELLSVLTVKRPEMKVVIATSYGSIATAVKAMRWGAVSYLPKPVTADELLAEAFCPACHCTEEGLPIRPKSADDLQALTLDRALWEYVNQVIETTGSLAGAARHLGVDRRNLRRMLAKYAPPPTSRMQS